MSRVSTEIAMVLALAAAPAAAASDYFLKLGDIKASTASASGGKHLEIESYAWGTTSAKGKVEHEWKVEEGESAPPVGGSEKLTVGGGRTEASGQATGKRQHKPLRSRDYVDTSASAQASGKRQYKPITIAKEWDAATPLAQPLDRGSVTVKGRFPDCLVGATYPAALLQTAAGRYELSDVVISGCAPNGVALNYKKVTVRGWDPAKKEE